MTGYAFPGDLLGRIRAGWDAVPSRRGFDLPDDETLRRLASIRATIAQTVAQMPTQEEFLAANGGAIDPAMRMFA